MDKEINKRIKKSRLENFLKKYNEQGIGLIENIDPLPVWQYIKENWPVSQNT